jgi:hypothetical protein
LWALSPFQLLTKSPVLHCASAVTPRWFLSHKP